MKMKMKWNKNEIKWNEIYSLDNHFKHDIISTILMQW